MSDAPKLGARLRAGVLEVGLAIFGLLIGTVLFWVLGALGLLPTEGALGRGVQMAAGPGITLVAALSYRALNKYIDASENPMLGSPREKPAPFTRASVGVALGIATLGIGAAIGGSFVLGLGLEAVGAPVAEQGTIVELVEGFKAGGDALPFVMLAISAVALAPMAEEFLFRGLVFRRIAERSNALPEAFVLSAAAFASIHTNPAGFVIYIWLGLVFAESYRRSGRLWVAMLVHAGNNAFALSLLVWG
ncbi:MAG: lysostaphin resistance A-like protein [Nannocystaceae bacterium]|nr:CPBP family intramembrane metalloprotease [bacterium]